MKNKLVIFLFLAITTLVSCDEAKKKSEKDVPSTTEKIADCKTLLIIAEDRSGSTSSHRKLTAQDYKKIITEFQEKANGQVAIRVIGNPAPAEREFFTLQVAAQKPYIEIPKDALMSKKGKLRKENQKIAKENKVIATKNKKNASKFIGSKVTKHVLNYKPYKGRDLTNIKDALQHIETKIKEPTFKSYDKVQVLIISDGKHDATKLKEELKFQPSENLDLYLIGWEDQNVFSNVTNIESFESVDGFTSYYKTLNCE